MILPWLALNLLLLAEDDSELLTSCLSLVSTGFRPVLPCSFLPSFLLIFKHISFENYCPHVLVAMGFAGDGSPLRHSCSSAWFHWNPFTSSFEVIVFGNIHPPRSEDLFDPCCVTGRFCTLCSGRVVAALRCWRATVWSAVLTEGSSQFTVMVWTSGSLALTRKPEVSMADVLGTCLCSSDHLRDSTGVYNSGTWCVAATMTLALL